MRTSPYAAMHTSNSLVFKIQHAARYFMTWSPLPDSRGKLLPMFLDGQVTWLLGHLRRCTYATFLVPMRIAALCSINAGTTWT